MKRRSFLQTIASASAISPLIINGFNVKAFEPTNLFTLAGAVDCDERVLVLIQLNGGNDGLNTIIPLDQYSQYYAARTSIAVPEKTIIKLSDTTGINPEMTGMKSLFDQGKLKVLHSVGYPTPNYSHFRSTDIWLSGSDTEEYFNTGVMGRYLDYRFPGYPSTYPNASMSDPLAIQIGSVLSTGFEGPHANMAMAFTDPTSFYNIVNEKDITDTSSRSGLELAYIRKVGEQLNNFAKPVKNAALKVPKNVSSLYPAHTFNTPNPLSEQLKIVARLIAGGLKTKIYMVNLSGFDTHSSTTNVGFGVNVNHANLLKQLSTAITAFMDDCKLLGIQDKVLGMTFSEFGRRIKSNGTGTDHGAAGPVFLFGNSVIPGFLGTNPIIPDNVSSEDNIPMQTDFRSLYSSLLTQWFCVPQKDIPFVTLHNYANNLPILQGISNSITNETLHPLSLQLSLFPNPILHQSQLQIQTLSPIAEIVLYDRTGKLMSTISGYIPEGNHTVLFERVGLSAGQYYLQARLINGYTQSIIVNIQ